MLEFSRPCLSRNHCLSNPDSPKLVNKLYTAIAAGFNAYTQDSATTTGVTNSQIQQRQGQWHRSNTHSGSIPPKPQPPRAPISVSAKTRSKLQQFQFQKTDHEEDSRQPLLAEENAVTEVDAVATLSESKEVNKVSSGLTLTNASAATPASRLAWQDLMGAEDAEKQHKDTSPEERLQWHIEQGQVVADTSPLVSRRRKKRARSSSPVSSPAVEKMRTPAVNVKKLKQAMDSPRADPAFDLWDRFSVGAPDSKNPLGATNPALAHLMISSSPRPSKDAVPTHSGSGLRRAISCGSHWPKRRRVEATTEAGPAREQGQTSKSSMVTALLETVNGEINRSDEMEEVEFGMESPSFKKRRSPTKPTASPAIAASRQSPEAHVTATEQVQSIGDEKTPSSDYGDDDFDDDTMWELDASLLSGQAETGSFTAVEHALATGSMQKPNNIKEDSYLDEFDDVDDDVLAAAAEDMLAEVTPSPSLKADPSTHTKAVHLDGGTDDPEDTYEDEFGGDFDFEAVELAATQSACQKASSLMPVRTV